MYNAYMMVKDFVQELERRYPLELAESWDFPGLIAGSPESDVDLVVFALDATLEVVEFALEQKRSDQKALIITHHPLFFRPVHKLGGDTFRGDIINKMLQGGVALYNAHTNADAATGGVADALANLLGVQNTTPIVPSGNPQEGLGRVGELSTPVPLREFAQMLTSTLPLPDVRVAGDLDKPVQRIALMPGAGDSMFEDVQKTNPDVYLTSDLRHHPVLDAKMERDFAIIDVPHFSSEFPWVKALHAEFAARSNVDGTYKAVLFEVPTDPWDLKL